MDRPQRYLLQPLKRLVQAKEEGKQSAVPVYASAGAGGAPINEKGIASIPGQAQKANLTACWVTACTQVHRRVLSAYPVISGDSCAESQ